MVSGRKLAKGEGNAGHIVARAKGGKRTWENLVYMDSRLNTLQGTKLPEEMGWNLLTTPRAPKPIPASFHITEPKSPDQQPFVNDSGIV
jgi:5-methylcytosine-specific restriction endonuclease McrA